MGNRKEHAQAVQQYADLAVRSAQNIENHVRAGMCEEAADLLGQAHYDLGKRVSNAGWAIVADTANKRDNPPYALAARDALNRVTAAVKSAQQVFNGACRVSSK